MTSGNEIKQKISGVFYLWHLESIGLLNDDRQPVDGWLSPNQNGQPDEKHDADSELTSAAAGPRARVAIIDNGCASRHPNLDPDDKGTRIVDAMEFAAYPRGTVYRDLGSKNPFKGLAKKLEDDVGVSLADILEEEIGRDLRHVLFSILEDTPLAPKCLLPLPDPSERFAAHGTSCAGLVAADARIQPTEVELNEARSEDKASGNPNAIKYSGVDPQAEIIPIATVYSPDYWPVIMGLLYAVAVDADVILLPRAVEDMAAPPTEHCDPGDPEPRSRLDIDPHRYAEKQVFEKLLSAISKYRPVVVPAGNSGLSRLDYPASLVHKVAPHLIVVGAATARGLPSSYSSYSAEHDPNGNGVTVYAPSDDREEISDTFIRYDEMLWRGRQLELGHGWEQNSFSPYGILAIDVPRQYGYSAEPGPLRDYEELGVPDDVKRKREERAEHRPRAIYTLFGGTSAAASIVAGVLSRMQFVAGATLSGVEAKKVLQANVKDGENIEARSAGHVAVHPLDDSAATALSHPEHGDDGYERGCKPVTTMIDAIKALREVRKKNAEAPAAD